MGGYQLQDASEAMQFAAHLRQQHEGPATPFTGKLWSRLDTVRAPPQPRAPRMQRPVDEHVQVCFCPYSSCHMLFFAASLFFISHILHQPYSSSAFVIDIDTHTFPQAAFAQHPGHLRWATTMADPADIQRFQQHAQALSNPILPDHAAPQGTLAESQALAIVEDLERTDVSLELLTASAICQRLKAVSEQCPVPRVQRRAADLCDRWTAAAASCLVLATNGLTAGTLARKPH